MSPTARVHHPTEPPTKTIQPYLTQAKGVRVEELVQHLRKSCRRGCVLAISGVPGTGKSTVAARLSEMLGWERVNLSEVALEHGLVAGEDKGRGTYVIDEDAVRAWVRRRASGSPLIVDSHYGEIVDDDILLKIFVLRLRPDILLERLLKRGWGPRKVRENVEAELLGICTANALGEHPREKVCEVDATGKTADEVAEEILMTLAGERGCSIGIDWVSDPDIAVSVLSSLARLENLREPD